MRDACRPIDPHAPCCFASLINFIKERLSELQFQGNLRCHLFQDWFFAISQPFSSRRQFFQSFLDFGSSEAKPVQLLHQLLAIAGTQAQLHTQLKALLLALQSNMTRLWQQHDTTVVLSRQSTGQSYKCRLNLHGTGCLH